MTNKGEYMQINLSGFSSGSRVNGPGLRAVVWVQGCPLGCAGCFNPHTHDAGKTVYTPVAQLADRVLALSNIEGVTFSGGEPFEQADALAALAQTLRSSGLSIMSFSGYTMDEIKASDDPHKLALLAQLDILVDGRFDIRQKAPLRWRGSSNQQVHFLTSKYRDWNSRINEPVREIELQLSNAGAVLISGFLDPKEEIKWRTNLATFGIQAQRVDF